MYRKILGGGRLQVFNFSCFMSNGKGRQRLMFQSQMLLRRRNGAPAKFVEGI